MFAQRVDPVLNVHHLELFYYVARAGGISAALETIPYGIQQPAISTQISRLEQSVGRKLFQRRPFALTPTGRHIYQQIAPFFSSLTRLADESRNEAQQHIRLAASPSVLRDHLPGLLKRLQAEVVDLRITLREGNQAVAERMLIDQEIDLAVALLESKPVRGIQHEVLIKLPMVLLVERGTRYVTGADVIRAAANLPLIAPPERDQLCVLFHQELAGRGIQWPARIEASYIGLIEAYVAHGFGIGLSVDTPGVSLSPRVRALRLRGFPQLAFAAIWRSELPVVAEKFLRLARIRARELRSAGSISGADAEDAVLPRTSKSRRSRLGDRFDQLD